RLMIRSPYSSLCAIAQSMASITQLALPDPSAPSTFRLTRCASGAMPTGASSVFALGSPHGLEHTFTAGIISALREDSLQTDATAAPGSSGGPLLDAQGRLAGVMTRSHAKKDYSFALYADAVLDALSERRLKAGALLP
ncbi:MAG: trypsin-like peptidase domain-containing protein, partial [Elusimicrobia bacterium]|nr:trypsin-like peptidase domain-containing protein [Elusimicrobiota bacterium]